MPAELFDPRSRPAPVGAGRRLTVTTSVVVHAAVVIAVVVVPLIGGVSLPAAMSRIDAFVAPPALPPAPQPPAPAASTPRLNPNAAPTTAPPEIRPENPALDLRIAPGVPEVPGGIPGASLGVPGGLPNIAPQPAPAPEPAPEKAAPVRAGGKVQFPKRVHFVEPVYPQIAVAARVEGTVYLEATIDEHGAVTNLRVLQPSPLLEAAAVEAVRKWRYSPTTLNGVRVPVVMTVTVTFKLR